MASPKTLAPKTLAMLAVPADTAPMEAKLVEHLPDAGDWQFEPKWDGFRCLAFRAGDEIELKAKSGKPLGRYFPEVVANLLRLPQSCFVLDGELAVLADGTFSFDALLQRIHPAPSRIRLLSDTTPAVFILFDMLLDSDGKSLLRAPLMQRRAKLEAFFARAEAHGWLRLSPYSLRARDAEAWLKEQSTGLDGVVAKNREGPYLPGERAMLKVKQMRTADCVVGGFRYRTGSREVGSLLLGLYNENGKLDHVGFTSTIRNDERAGLTARLQDLEEGPGFSGNAPGGPSRWSTERSGDWHPLRPELVVEVGYDQVTGQRFRHGTRLIRFRPDKAPRTCTLDQIEPRPTQMKRRGTE